MRGWSAGALAFALLITVSHDTFGTPAGDTEYHLIAQRRVLGAGESTTMRISPPPPEGVRAFYSVETLLGAGSTESRYIAPFVIPVGTPPVRVFASIASKGVRARASVEISLTPGTVPGADDCLGPGQSWSRTSGDIEPRYLYVDTLPELVHRVEPAYPRIGLARGILDTIPVLTLVCKSGRVIEAHALETYRTLGASMVPIERDPLSEQAAIDAAKQYVFRPARSSGQAVAVHVFVPIVVRH